MGIHYSYTIHTVFVTTAVHIYFTVDGAEFDKINVNVHGNVQQGVKQLKINENEVNVNYTTELCHN